MSTKKTFNSPHPEYFFLFTFNLTVNLQLQIEKKLWIYNLGQSVLSSSWNKLGQFTIRPKSVSLKLD